MSLTKDDLKSIKDIIQEVVPGIVQEIVDKAIDDSDMRTANGFAEMDMRFEKTWMRQDDQDKNLKDVYVDLSTQIDDLDGKVSVKDQKLDNTVKRVDRLMLHAGMA